MIRSKLSSVALATYLTILAGCGAKPAVPAAPTGSAASGATVKEPGEAKIGDTTKCPVSGEDMTVEASSPKSEYQGKTYFFCCSGCKKKFDADPARYLKKS